MILKVTDNQYDRLF